MSYLEPAHEHYRKDPLYKRACRVFDSCTSVYQLPAAMKYVDLICKKQGVIFIINTKQAVAAKRNKIIYGY